MQFPDDKCIMSAGPHDVNKYFESKIIDSLILFSLFLRWFFNECTFMYGQMLLNNIC